MSGNGPTNNDKEDLILGCLVFVIGVPMLVLFLSAMTFFTVALWTFTYKILHQNL